MLDLYKDIVNSILVTKRDVLLTEDDEKVYNPWFVNISLSWYYDTIMFANEMNKYPLSPKKMQYAYLMNTVRGKKRPFKRWDKYTKPENLDIVKQYYSCSNAKAVEILRLLPEKEIVRIKQKLDKGGIKSK